MRIEYIGFWIDQDDLVRRIQRALNNGAVVIVKNLIQTEPRFAEMLPKFGTPSVQYPGRCDSVLHMGEDAPGWYNTKIPFTYHFDGIQQIAQKEIMPITLLYAAEISGVVGGQTYFCDPSNLWDRVQADPILSQIDWDRVYGQYTHDLTKPLTRVKTLRKSVYTNRPYLLIDEWFTQRLEYEDGSVLPSAILNRYQQMLADECAYYHMWEPNDMVVWSNETALHGRTGIADGTRLMWRGVVWYNQLMIDSGSSNSDSRS